MPFENVKDAPNASGSLITHLSHLAIVRLSTRQRFDLIDRLIFRSEHDGNSRAVSGPGRVPL